MGLEIAVVMAMPGAIFSEFVGAQNGLGVLVSQAQFQLQAAAVFALLIILSVIGDRCHVELDCPTAP